MQKKVIYVLTCILITLMLFSTGCAGTAAGVASLRQAGGSAPVAEKGTGQTGDNMAMLVETNKAGASGADGPLTVLYIPLDNRPLNYDNVFSLAAIAGVKLLTPPPEMLGNPGENGGQDGPGDPAAIGEWLAENADRADAWIISLDMLLYGGLAPSRSHDRGQQEVLADMQNLQQLLAQNRQDVPVYAFATIMRSAASSASPKQPGYFAGYGDKILQLSQLWDRADRGDASPDQMTSLAMLKKEIPPQVLGNYLQRRETNLAAIRQALHLVAGGLVDYLVLGRDDTTPYSLTRVDLRRLENDVRQRGLTNRVDSYPGADELGALLLARAVNEALDRQLKVYVDWATPQGPGVTALYEDVTLEENVRLHVKSGGGKVVESPEEADLMLAMNSPVVKTMEAAVQPEYAAPGQHHLALADQINTWLEQGKPVAVADVAYANGADRAFMEILAGYAGNDSDSGTSSTTQGNNTGGRLSGNLSNQWVSTAQVDSSPLPRLAGYAGCNTAGNSIGMALAHGMIYSAAALSIDRLATYSSNISDEPGNAYANSSGSSGSINNNPANSTGPNGIKKAELYKEAVHQKYLLTRVIEDWGFQADVRPAIIKNENFGATAAGDPLGKETAAQMELEVTDQLNDFLSEHLPYTFENETRVANVTLPWNRLFDISITLE